MLKINKIVTSILIITFAFSPIFAVSAHAQWVVWDPGNFVPNTVTAVNTTIVAGTQIAETTKEYGLDAVFFVIAKLIIQRMAASTVKWINSGFSGSPAFVTDPASYYKDLGDKIAGQYIYNNPNLNFLCGDMSVKVKLALSRSYNNDNMAWRCSLTEVVDNLDNFMNDFEKGGWDGFFELTQRQQNNPIGVYLQASDAMYNAIENTSQLKREELSQGAGFLSYKKCKVGAEMQSRDAAGLGSCDTTYNNCLKGAGSEGAAQCSTQFKACEARMAGVAVGACRENQKDSVTPGSVISNQLNKTLGAGTDALVTADEMNEVVSALLNQLLGKVMGGIGGLLGTSDPGSTGEKAFTNQLASSTVETTKDYFETTVNTSILNDPTPNLDYDLNAGKPSGNSNYFNANCAVNPSLPECLPSTIP